MINLNEVLPVVAEEILVQNISTMLQRIVEASVNFIVLVKQRCTVVG